MSRDKVCNGQLIETLSRAQIVVGGEGRGGEIRDND
jgi:hypothetical protein